ncbi:2-C-methyl-D-erythritol 4-phosphate cytidylyltransferase [Paenibacillus sp. LX16]|uniref:2-C-methyl-D-erythritol 4-phosphate cytidylyltransferase n=1 Tax=Paenibacillus sp. LX16 TaxID=1740264 RepID=UPI0019F9938C|nr:2-C-methyl-D-erythritol 4-phosphate cytidylyltransferase [Paenibacillus sp. LX16]KAF6625583.1 2-C-methyl-D-erythritol 4-phosphate cytidylyltransferase [Paenibacillus sp. EKM208P]
MNNRVGVVIVAAGRGSRMGTQESKQFLLLRDKPIFIHTLEIFAAMPEVDEMVMVTGTGDVERCRDWIHQYKIGKNVQVVAGGSERQHSVFRGLRHLQADWVMVHDGVRPLIQPELVRSCLEAAQRTGASVAAVPVKDTVKQVNGDGIITATPDRRSLWSIQTPQTFRLSDLLRAYEEAEQSGFLGTDDSMLIERLGIPVTVVHGSYKNIKITTPEDLDMAALWVKTEGEDIK